MKPVIGIPLGYEYSTEKRSILYLGEKVRRTFQKAGVQIYPIVPVQDVDYMKTKGNEFLPLTEEEKKQIDWNLEKCDGIFFPGGSKFTPYDRYLLECTIKKKIPTLGVCLGMQMMSCYLEDVKLEKNHEGSSHNQLDDNKLTHKVKLDSTSKLYEILGVDELMVNSFHNYHALENHIYKTVGYSTDGLIEALEFPSNTFHIGVQWHPEISYSFDENSRKIIDYFIEEACRYQQDKKSHSIVNKDISREDISLLSKV